MGNTRSQQVSNSQAAHDRAETNKGAAASSNSVPALRIVVAGNGDAIQENTAAIQRLERLFLRLTQGSDGGVSGATR